MFLPALPCLPATDAAAFEEPAIAVFDHDIVSSQQMALFAGREFGPDNRPLQPVVSRIATGFTDADGKLPGAYGVSLRNRPYESLPKQTRRLALAIVETEHSVTFFALGAFPDPAPGTGLGDPFHEIRLADNLHAKLQSVWACLGGLAIK